MDQIKYKGHFIVKLEHPKLAGKYEVFKDDDMETHLSRASTIQDAKDDINNAIAQ